MVEKPEGKASLIYWFSMTILLEQQGKLIKTFNHVESLTVQYRCQLGRAPRNTMSDIGNRSISCSIVFYMRFP